MGKDQELLEAARNGNIQVVEKILSQRAKRSGPLASLRRGPGANVQDSSGYSALHHAALNGHKEIVELLLSYEASTNIVDTKGSSPLHLAAWTGNLDIVRTLLCHGPSVPNVNLMTKDNETALHCAAQYGHTPVVSLLLEFSCDPTIRNVRGETPLDLAAQYGRLDTVDTLVRTHPALVHAYNTRAPSAIFPSSPLHLASRNGHRSVVARLLQAGLEVNIRTAAGTALHEAALCGKLEVVKTLLEHGADLRIIDSNHNTVLDILNQFPPHAVQDIAAIINHYWADSTNGGGGDGHPPMPVASLGSPYENVKLKFNPPSSPGASPLQWEHLRRDRRTSALSAHSFKSVDLGNHRPTSHHHSTIRSRDISYFSDDHASLYLHDLDDSVSVCSTASSSASKISPTPPKKPPRRNLSVSPSHLMSDLSVASAVMSYEFLVSGGGSRSVSDTDDMQLPHTPRAHPLRRGKSADQCTLGAEFTPLRFSSTIDIDSPSPSLSRGTSEDILEGRAKYPPIALTSVTESGPPLRTTNPKRKLKRLQDRERENDDPTGPALNSLLKRGDLPFRKIDPKEFMPQPITVERILSPSSDRSNFSGASGPKFSLFNNRIRVLSNGGTNGWPLSPTHYHQPPTPEHPPPSAKQAEQIIQERIRPLSQEYKNLKRKSRDMETETEDELLMLVFHDNSSSSLSSSFSMSEKSVQSSQTDTTGLTPDLPPFAGLLKGSSTGDKSSTSSKAERPTSLSALKSVYEESPSGDARNATASVLSPFDEQEEWARISEIMATIGSGLVKESGFVSELEQEFQARLGLSRSGSLTDSSPVAPLIEPASESAPDVPVVQSVQEWLETCKLQEYKDVFLNYGYDHEKFLNGILSDTDLADMGISSAEHREVLLKSAESLPAKVKEVQDALKTQSSDKSDEEQIADWLSLISLECYVETFRKNLFVEIERIKKIWEVELTAVLEINKPAHRKRILISLDRLSSGPNLDQISSDLNQLKSSKTDALLSKPSTNGMGAETLRRKKKLRPAPQPPVQKPPLQPKPKDIEDLKPMNVEDKKKLNAIEGKSFEVVEPSDKKSEGTLNSINTNSQGMQNGQSLVNGSVTYLATYLGSTVVKEMSMDCSKQATQKLKTAKPDGSHQSPEIFFSISHQGVKFLNPLEKSLICEHEIRNIHCACQDPEDLAYFSYITKDNVSGAHFSHVFFVKNKSQVVEIILTLKQAVEISSTLRKNSKPTDSKTMAGQGRSRSVNQSVTPGTPPSVQHSRSLSVHEGNYLNGASTLGEIAKAPIACSEEL